MLIFQIPIKTRSLICSSASTSIFQIPDKKQIIDLCCCSAKHIHLSNPRKKLITNLCLHGASMFIFHFPSKKTLKIMPATPAPFCDGRLLARLKIISEAATGAASIKKLSATG